MTAARGSDISSSDYVTLQNSAEMLLGTGTGSRGYGQPLVSADVYSGNTITKAQWDQLRYDITSIKYHQEGTLPAIVTVNSGDLVSYGSAHPSVNYKNILDVALINRFRISPSTSVISSVDTKTYTSAWNTLATMTVTVTFDNSNDARYFFNSGGKIRVTSSRSGGAETAQNGAWTNLLNAVGTQSFGADTHPNINYYTLTDTYQTYMQQQLSTPYSTNHYGLSAKCNVADNSNGTATTIDILIEFSDAHLPAPIDQVSGTLSVHIEELKATGGLFPTGTFTITSPSYSISNITAS